MIDPYAVIILAGDLNNLQTNFANLFNLTQLVKFATYTRSNNTLDKIFTNHPDLFLHPSKMSPVGLSDHYGIFLSPGTPLNQREKNKNSESANPAISKLSNNTYPR